MKILNYINGELKEPIGNLWMDNYEPATGEIYSQIADSDLCDVELAVAAAENAFENWSNIAAEERAKILLRIADIIDSKLDFLSEAESRDNGKPIKLASVVDIPRASSNFRFLQLPPCSFLLMHTSPKTRR